MDTNSSWRGNGLWRIQKVYSHHLETKVVSLENTSVPHILFSLKFGLYNDSIISADPLAYVMQSFREYVFELSVYSLVTPGYETDSIIGPNRGSNGTPHTSETLQHTQLLAQCSSCQRDKTSVSNDSVSLISTYKK